MTTPNETSAEFNARSLASQKAEAAARQAVKTVSYHDVHVTVPHLGRVALCNLPYGYKITCTRVGGWELWNEVGCIGGEFNKEWPLVIDVAGEVICSNPPHKETISHRVMGRLSRLTGREG